ncbi:MAG: DUF2250 domain-containing protein [Halobacteriota archaeon]
MVSRAEIDRLRTEADTIMTRIATVDDDLQRARTEAGDHWDTGVLEVSLSTPRGEEITIDLDIDVDAAENAQSRYERAKRLEAELERRREVVGELAAMPADPVAYLLCYHLDSVGANYPRSIAGHLDADRAQIVDLCDRLQTAGLLERVESGTVKRRRAKAKRSDEVRQHHTYYRLAREGDHLLRFLSTREGKANVLKHLPDGLTIVRRLARGGPDYPRMTAAELELAFEYVRHLYRALRRVGLVTVYEGSTIKGRERKLKPKSETHKKHTYYVTTSIAEAILGEIDQ